MTPEHWQEVDRLLGLALELEPWERSQFLHKACAGNVELRQEVEALLKAHEQAGSFIEVPALDVTAKGLTGHRTESLVGQELGNYKILSLLGAGGMGEVYLAQDRKLGRKIALKLLPTQFSYDKERLRRFEREAQAASALNHPNILTVHEIGQAGNTTFMATEFVDGQTLRQRMLRSQLGLPETLDIAIQVASALAAAHELHIMHRDIKPENIMLRRDGYVKVLDFGLAKLMEPHQRSSGTLSLLTESGMLVGTVQYMSPEQARGQEVDHRTDIFSLGAVLYEMTAGTMPFKGSTIAAVSDGILHQTPTPLRQLKPNIPEELERVIVKTLEKDRELRYQTASDLRADLKRIQRDTDLLQASKLPKAEAERIPQWPAPAINLRQRLTIAGMLAGLVVALLTGWYIWQYAKPQPRIIMTQRQLTTNSGSVLISFLSGLVVPFRTLCNVKFLTKFLCHFVIFWNFSDIEVAATKHIAELRNTFSPRNSVNIFDSSVGVTTHLGIPNRMIDLCTLYVARKMSILKNSSDDEFAVRRDQPYSLRPISIQIGRVCRQVIAWDDVKSCVGVNDTRGSLSAVNTVESEDREVFPIGWLFHSWKTETRGKYGFNGYPSPFTADEIVGTSFSGVSTPLTQKDLEPKNNELKNPNPNRGPTKPHRPPGNCFSVVSYSPVENCHIPLYCYVLFGLLPLISIIGGGYLLAIDRKILGGLLVVFAFLVWVGWGSFLLASFSNVHGGQSND